MLDSLIPYLEEGARLAATWGPVMVLLLMTIESSFIPFPSEIVMIPAGFLSARGEFFPRESGLLAVLVAVVCGISGSLIGAYLNYYLSLKLGRPFLHKYGKYFFLPSEKLDRAEEVFRKYGDVTTFICRLIPVIRQLISIPAGLSRMDFGRFSLFTALGAGVWVIFLSGIGFWLGEKTREMTWKTLVHRGKDLATRNLLWIILGALVLILLYAQVHKIVLGNKGRQKNQA